MISVYNRVKSRINVIVPQINLHASHVDGVARGGKQMSPLLLPPPFLAADAGVPGAQAPREEMADPLLLTPPCTVVTGILYLGD